MSENKKIRLSGVAREYNVGIGTLIEFLEKKGAGNSLNPNTQIEGENLDLIRKEFGKDKIEKVNIREIIRPDQHNVSLGDKPHEPVIAKEKEPVEEKEVVVKTSIFTPPAPEFKGPKIIGKVDLSGNKKQPAKQEETPTEAQKQTKPEAPIAPAEPIIAKPEKKSEPALVATIPSKKIEVASEETAPKTGIASEEKPAKIEVKTPEKSETVEAKKETHEKEQPIVATTKEQTPDGAAKEQPKATSNLFRANEPAKLSGPTVIGKIVLPDPNLGKRNDKGKRNRIKKNKVDITVPGTGTQPQTATGGNRRPAPGTGNSGNTPYRQGGVNNTRPSSNKPYNKNAPRPVIARTEVSDEEVQKQIKETLARLTNKGGKNKGAKYRRDKRDAAGQKVAEEALLQEQMSSTLQVTEFVTVSELATMMNADVNQVINTCMNLGLMVSINQRLDAEALAIVAEEFGFKVEFVAVEIQEAIDADDIDKEEDLLPRPPIVTVMGHVDHGKTSLLDYIRQANVIAGEAGGITQHIGAYSVEVTGGKRITFLDTPGHEAFTAMRARGAKVTDVAIIIIAADDDIMPQTTEAINHATAANVPIIFAINKIDKPASNPEKIKEQLSAMNYLVEDWGGKYQSQEISAKSGLNVDKLLEKIILESDMLELKANPNRKAAGSVIESTLDKGRGFVTTVLVQNGSLNVGDVILSGTHTGRVKAMFNERGKKIKVATPSTPVLVLGLNGAPQAGDMFNVMDDDKQARDIANKRDQLQRMQGLRTQKHITLDEIGRRIAIGTFQELNIIIKGDVDGSIEALADSLLKLGTEEVQVNIIHKAVGQISESDILLATASNAIIVGFQVRPSSTARKMAEQEEIDIRLYSIIYDAINEVKDAIEGMLAPETKEEITCSVEVIEVFKITKIGTIAGCMVREGKITRNTKIRVIRDGIVVYTGRLGSLKRFKDDVKEVSSGYDCGLNIDNFNDIKIGDFVEGYEQVEVARKLS